MRLFLIAAFFSAVFFCYPHPAFAAITGVEVNYQDSHIFSAYDNYAAFADDIQFDNVGNEYQLRSIYRVGSSVETADLNPGPGVDNYSLQNKFNLFITKYDSSGEYVDSYYLAHSAVVAGGFATTLLGLHVSDQGILVYGNAYSTTFTAYTTSGTTTLSAGQSVSNPVAILLRYNTDLSYRGANVTDNLIVRGIESNPNGGFYLSGAIQGTVDLDFMTGSTSSYSLANSPSTDGVILSYGNDGSFNYAYKYNAISPAAGSDVSVDELRVTDDRLYALLSFNSNTAPASVDLDPSGAQDLHSLHEHDPAIIVFDHSGNYEWSNVVSSSDVYGEYAFVDDENVIMFDVGSDGSAYVGLYSDSDAVQIGTTVYEKNITGTNNVHEVFVYQVKADGTTGWSKYFPSTSNTGSMVTDIWVEPLTNRVIATLLVQPGTIEVNGIQYQNAHDVARYLFIQLKGEDGVIERTNFLELNGVLSDLTWESVSVGFRSFTNTAANSTRLVFQMDLEATATGLNLDFTSQTNTNSSLIEEWTFYQLYSTLSPVITIDQTPSSSTSNQSSSPGSQQTTIPGCNLQPPGLKTPRIYAAIPLTQSSIQLYFTDADGPLDRYVVWYGTRPNNLQYAVLDIGGLGTRTYTIHDLSPDTTYYFKMRAGNGCAAGEWSNQILGKTLKMITTSRALNVSADSSDVLGAVDSEIVESDSVATSSQNVIIESDSNDNRIEQQQPKIIDENSSNKALMVTVGSLGLGGGVLFILWRVLKKKA